MITDSRQRRLVVDMNWGKPHLSGGRRAAEGRSVVDVRSIQSPGAGVTGLTVRCVRLSVRPFVSRSFIRLIDVLLPVRRRGANKDTRSSGCRPPNPAGSFSVCLSPRHIGRALAELNTARHAAVGGVSVAEWLAC